MQLEERVINVILNNSEDIDKIFIESDLREDLGIDSFGTIMIVNGIEEEFNITINDDYIEKINSVKDIAVMLQTQYGIEG